MTGARDQSTGEASAPAFRRRCLPGRTSLTVAVLLGLAASLRFAALGGLPPFFDELGNIAVSLSAQARKAIDPVRQARPFLAYQFKAAAFLPGDVLWAGRALTAVTGVGCVGLIFFVVRRVGGPAPALIASGLWAMNPYLVFHDRMALQDPFVSFFLLAGVACFVLHQRFPGRIDEPLRRSWPTWAAAGLLYGLAVATKISALIHLPFLGVLLWCFAARCGGQVRWSAGLAGRVVLLLSCSVLVVFAAAGTFEDYGAHLFRLGHFSNQGASDPEGSPPGVGGHLWRQYELVSAYMGGWAVMSFLALLAAGSVMCGTRLLALLSAGLILVDTAAYRGYWYTRYFHPDFVFHILLVSFTAPQLLARLVRTKTPERGVRLCYASAALVIAAGVIWTPRLWALVSDPLHAGVPRHDGYTAGFYSGLGVRELRAAIEKEVASHDHLVVFACQFWCPGMYDLFLRAQDDPRLFVVPLEINQEGRILTLLKVIERYRLNLPGDTAFAVLFETPRYAAPFPLEAFGLPLGTIFDLVREPAGRRPEARFTLKRLEHSDKAAVLAAFPFQTSPWPDGWVGPKAEFDLAAGPPDELRLIFPRELPPETEVEVALDGVPVIRSAVANLSGPVALPRSAATGPPRKLRVLCSDWFVPQLAGGGKDTRSLCMKLSAPLALSL